MNSFPLVPDKHRGYNQEQVDRFMATAKHAYDDGQLDELTARDVRATGFDMVKHGYDPAEVDAAMERIEDAFARRERDDAIARLGTATWVDEARTRARTVVARLQRPRGEKFDRGGVLAVGYDVAQVDAFTHRIVQHFTQNTPLPLATLRQVVFARKARGYDEAQVDALIDATIDIIQAVE